MAERHNGLEELLNSILKNAANKISPSPKIIFDQFLGLERDKLPDDWVEADVAYVFKKGIGSLRQTIGLGHYPSHVLAPIYSNKSFVNKFVPFRKKLTPAQHGF